MVRWMVERGGGRVVPQQMQVLFAENIEIGWWILEVEFTLNFIGKWLDPEIEWIT